MNKIICSVFLMAGALTSCYHVPDKIEPKMNYAVQDRYLKSLPSPFPPLTEAERSTDWGREYQIGLGFAHALDLYQAITAFKRAEILAPQELQERRREILYEILLCYYLGKKYDDVIHTFENSELRFVNQSFPPYHDLLLFLYDSYRETHQEEKAARIMALMQEQDPKTADKLDLSTAFMEGDIQKLEERSKTRPGEEYLTPFLTSYENEKKSIGKAQALNALLPGAGYLYLGQKKSALTAVLLNGLFIAATVHFFQHGHVAAGAIFASFEAGWYFGGIYGAGEETKFYNERLFERKAAPIMNSRNLFPVLMLNYAF
jgi:hypothetical protein